MTPPSLPRAAAAGIHPVPTLACIFATICKVPVAAVLGPWSTASRSLRPLAARAGHPVLGCGYLLRPAAGTSPFVSVLHDCIDPVPSDLQALRLPGGLTVVSAYCALPVEIRRSLELLLQPSDGEPSRALWVEADAHGSSDDSDESDFSGSDVSTSSAPSSTSAISELSFGGDNPTQVV